MSCEVAWSESKRSAGSPGAAWIRRKTSDVISRITGIVPITRRNKYPAMAPRPPPLLLHDDVGAENAAGRIRLELDRIADSMQHAVAPHEACRRRVLDRLECDVELLLARGRIELDPPVSKYCDKAGDGSTTEPRPI